MNQDQGVMPKDAQNPAQLSVPETPTVSRLIHRQDGRPEIPPLFVAGQTVAERFHICRFIGQGGMGQVFEAEDLTLGHRVALKVVRPDLARTGKALKQFRKEVLLARRVTHPHVCRIFDVFLHDPPGPEAPIMVLSMEFLGGETLAAKLARDGPLPRAASRPLIRQMATALDAAHRAGVIHLDFKSTNVLLVREDEGIRAVVTDFGLARSIESTENDRRRTRHTAGTPGYMAPELARGGMPTPAADIYSFGVVCHELLAGRLPSQDETEDPGLSARWARALRYCLADHPEQRPPSAAALLPLLDEEHRGFPRGAVMVALVVLALGVGSWMSDWSGRLKVPWAPRGVTVSNFTPQVREHRLAVDATTFAHPHTQQLYAGALAALQNHDISTGLDLLRQVVEVEPHHPWARSALAQAVQELGYGEKAREEAGKAFALAKDLSREGQMLLEARYRGAEKDWPRATQLYEALWTFFPDDLEYGLGAAYARKSAGRYTEAFDVLAALRELPPPRSLDPRIDLAEAHIAIDQSDFKRAREAASRARAGAEDRGARLLLADALRAFGRAAGRLGINAEAKEAFDRSRSLYRQLGVARGEADSTLQLARIEAQSGSHEVAHELYEIALRQCRAIGNRSLEVKVLSNYGILFWQEARLDRAEDLFGQALALSRETNDRIATADMLNNLGMIQESRGRLEAAEDLYLQAMEAYRAIDRRIGQAAVANNLAIIYFDRGAWERALTAWEDVVEITHEAGFREGEIGASQNIGLVYLHRGALAEATEWTSKAVALAEEIDELRLLTGALLDQARVLLETDALKDAERLLERAVALAAERGDPLALAQARWLRAELLREQGALEGAEKEVRGALQGLRQVEDSETQFRARCLLARLLVERGSLPEARLLVAEIEEHHGSEDPLLRALTASKSLAAEGRLNAAAERLEVVLAETSTTGSLPLQLKARLYLARIAAQQGRKEAAQELLNNVATLARTHDLSRVLRHAGDLRAEWPGPAAG